MKDNKLIAEFMGYTFADYDLGGLHYLIDGNYVEYNSLQYHTSWDWLMPVLVKIEKIEVGDGTWTSVYFDIEREHKKAVEFIKTYNDGNARTD